MLNLTASLSSPFHTLGNVPSQSEKVPSTEAAQPSLQASTLKSYADIAQLLPPGLIKDFPDLSAFCRESQLCFCKSDLTDPGWFDFESFIGKVFVDPIGRSIIIRNSPLPGPHDLNGRDLTPSEIELMLDDDFGFVNSRLEETWSQLGKDEPTLISLYKLDSARTAVLQHLFFFEGPWFPERSTVYEFCKLVGTEQYSKAAQLLSGLKLAQDYPELASLLRKRLLAGTWSGNVVLAFFEKMVAKLVKSLRISLLSQPSSGYLTRNLRFLKSEAKKYYPVCLRPTTILGKTRIAVNREAAPGEFMLMTTNLDFEEVRLVTITSLIQALKDLDRMSGWWRKLDAGRQRALLHLCMMLGTGWLERHYSDFLTFVKAGRFEEAAKLILDPEGELSRLAKFAPYPDGIAPMSRAPELIATLIAKGEALTVFEDKMPSDGLPSYQASQLALVSGWPKEAGPFLDYDKVA